MKAITIFVLGLTLHLSNAEKQSEDHIQENAQDTPTNNPPYMKYGNYHFNKIVGIPTLPQKILHPIKDKEYKWIPYPCPVPYPVKEYIPIYVPQKPHFPCSWCYPWQYNGHEHNPSVGGAPVLNIGQDYDGQTYGMPPQLYQMMGGSMKSPLMGGPFRDHLFGLQGQQSGIPGYLRYIHGKGEHESGRGPPKGQEAIPGYLRIVNKNDDHQTHQDTLNVADQNQEVYEEASVEDQME